MHESSAKGSSREAARISYHRHARDVEEGCYPNRGTLESMLNPGVAFLETYLDTWTSVHHYLRAGANLIPDHQSRYHRFEAENQS